MTEPTPTPSPEAADVRSASQGEPAAAAIISPSAASAAELFPHWSLIRRLIVGAVVVVLLFYGIWWATIYHLQDEVFFPRSNLPLPAAELGYPNAMLLKRPIPGGEAVAAFIPAPEALGGAEPVPLVIYFHGHHELIDYQDHVVTAYQRMGFSLLLPEYRGFGRSAGEPAQAALREDMVWFYDEAMKRPEVDRSRVVFHGRQTGGAVAVDLAAQRQPRAMVLESTFLSGQQMLRDLSAPALLAKNPFRSDQVLARLDVPVLIFHGRNDDMVPVEQARQLAAMARQAKLAEFDDGAADFPGVSRFVDFWMQLAAFYDVTGVRPAPSLAPTQEPTPSADPTEDAIPTAPVQP